MAESSPKRGTRTAGGLLTVRATRQELAAIRAVATERGTTTAQMVRQALKAQGVAIEP